MGKVKSDFSKKYVLNGEEVRIIVVLDVSDEAEGYGVVIGDENSDRTIAFGQGPLAYLLADALVNAIATELEGKDELPDEGFEFDSLESLCTGDDDEILSNESTFEELTKITDYIRFFTKG